MKTLHLLPHWSISAVINYSHTAICFPTQSMNQSIKQSKRFHKTIITKINYLYHSYSKENGTGKIRLFFDMIGDTDVHGSRWTDLVLLWWYLHNLLSIYSVNLYHIASYYIISYYIRSSHVISYYIILCYTISYYVILCYIISYYIRLHHIISYQTIYTILYHIKSRLFLSVQYSSVQFKSN